MAEGGMNATLFNVEQKARIFCYLANSEYKMRNKYEDFSKVAIVPEPL